MQTTSHSPARKRRRFADLMIEALRRCGETGPISYDAAEFELRVGADPATASIINLRNAYDSYWDVAPVERAGVLKQFATGLVESGRSSVPDRWADAWRHLLPTVRARHSFDQPFPAGLPGGGTGDGHRPIGEHLGVGLACDEPNAIRILGDGALAKWGVAWEDAFAVACDNLRKLSRQPFDSPAPGVFVSPWTDYYGASRLVLTDLIRDLEVKGEFVAIAPNRDTLIVTGSEDRAGLRVMQDLAEDSYRRPYKLSGIALRLRDGRWEPFEPDAAYPDLDGFRQLRVDSLITAYAVQWKELTTSLTGRGKDVFVAPYFPLEQTEGGPSTGCTFLGDACPVLLPRAEVVIFLRDRPIPGSNPIVAVAEWDRVQAVIGDLLTPVGGYPERFRLDRFPTDEQLTELGFAAGFETTANKDLNPVGRA